MSGPSDSTAQIMRAVPLLIRSLNSLPLNETQKCAAAGILLATSMVNHAIRAFQDDDTAGWERFVADTLRVTTVTATAKRDECIASLEANREPPPPQPFRAHTAEEKQRVGPIVMRPTVIDTATAIIDLLSERHPDDREARMVLAVTMGAMFSPLPETLLGPAQAESEATTEAVRISWNRLVAHMDATREAATDGVRH